MAWIKIYMRTRNYYHVFNIPTICHKFSSLKSRIAFQVARKIAPCDRAFSKDINDFLFIAFLFKRKRLSNIELSYNSFRIVFIPFFIPD